MSDNEKRENLANARRKVCFKSRRFLLLLNIFQLKKFRDQQPTLPLNNTTDIYSTNGVTLSHCPSTKNNNHHRLILSRHPMI